jgi:hypothetical protein
MAAIKSKYRNRLKLESDLRVAVLTILSVVSIGEDSMISFGDHGENRGSNLMGNNYNICTFSLITIPKNTPCISAYDD